ADLQFMIGAGKAQASRHAWDEAWMQIEKEPVGIALGSGWLAQRAEPGLPRGFEAFAPLWTKGHGYAAAFSINATQGIGGHILAAGGTEDGAEKVEQTARAVMTLAGNLMDDFHRQIGIALRESVEPMQLFADAVDPLLENVKSERKGRIVHMRSSSGVDLE